MWTLAITGLTLKTIFFHQLPEWLGLTFYLGMGWLGLITALLMYQHYGWRFLKPLVYGAMAYTLGALVDFMQFPTLVPGVVGPHELFHLGVLLGIAYHWILVNQVAWVHQDDAAFPALADMA